MCVKMFNMEFGECNIIETTNQCLIVDYGSIHREGNTLDNVKKEIDNNYLVSLNGLITHFHEDHYNGFSYLLSRYPHKYQFEQFFLPHIFQAYEHPNTLDYVLIDTYIRSKLKRSMPKETILDMISSVLNTGVGYTLLKRGDTFSTPGGNATVLWPEPQKVYSQLQKLNPYLYIPEDEIEMIFSISDSITRLLSNEQASGNINEERIRFNKLIHNGVSFNDNMTGKIRTYSGATYEATDSNSFYSRPDIKLLLSEILNKKIDHNYCLVFQTSHFGKGYLFTGDISLPVLKRILTLSDSSLLKNYYAVKAPHHGTKSHYCSELFNSKFINIDNVFISNGKGNKRYGKISKEYKHKAFHVICTNSEVDRCENYSSCISKNCGINQSTIPDYYII